jgi:hypothetical protein
MKAMKGSDQSEEGMGGGKRVRPGKRLTLAMRYGRGLLVLCEWKGSQRREGKTLVKGLYSMPTMYWSLGTGERDRGVLKKVL